MNAVNPSDSADQVKAGFCEILSGIEKSEPLEGMFREEAERLEAALKAGAEGFLKYFPGKSYFGFAANELGITKERFLDIFCHALGGIEESPLRTGVESELTSHLPERRISAM